ncbi:MAG TPA: ABC transporter ATP-binding protein [Chromatiaceae bacterium]|nr:ABC transporter ATP-binding protein [Chromatiaceae bacterium]
MSEQTPVISFQNVSKRFTFTKDKPSSVLEIFTSAFSRRSRFKTEDDNLWAVKDVSFDVLPGQAFGIVGRNGSGKSTVLKLVTRILKPTDGRIIVNGRVSALLELGAGFHQDLTGRENVYLNASLLGLSRAETDARFDDILAFSELDEFIDMPVKHYSSGMYMRLGFSVAINMDPDILIVDEILAVGDQPFQTKCIDAILDMKRRGVTIVFVSHDIRLMRQLCTHMLWLDKGVTQAQGTVEDVAQRYIEYSNMREGQQLLSPEFERWGTGEIEITGVTLLNTAGEPEKTYKTGESMTIEMRYFAHKPIPNPEFGLAIFRQDGVHINGPNTRLAGVDLGVVDGPGVVRYEIEKLPLLPSRYSLTVAVHDGRFPHCYDYHKEAYNFRIIPGGTTEQDGLFVLPAQWAWETSHPATTPDTITSLEAPRQTA